MWLCNFSALTFVCLQVKLKRELLRRIQEFRVDVIQFRNDYDANGPLVKGVTMQEAAARLHKYNVCSSAFVFFNSEFANKDAAIVSRA